MPEFKSLEKALAYIQKSVAEVTRNEVTEVVKPIYAEQAEKDVYAVYSPTEHVRKNSLSDEQNIIAEPVGEMGVSIKNIAKPSPSIVPSSSYSESATQLTEWIETGAAYHGRAPLLFPLSSAGDAWTKPRPFTRNTVKRLEMTKAHIKALRSGLSKKGIKTE